MIKRKLFVLCFVLQGVALFTSCEKIQLHGTGEKTTISKQLEFFHTIEMKDDIDVELFFMHNKPAYVEIEAGENLLQRVHTQVIDSVLYISNHNRMNWIRNYEKSAINIKVYAPPLRQIIYKGVSDLVFRDTLITDKFSFDCLSGMGSASLLLRNDSVSVLVHTAHAGAPDIVLSGRANYAHLYSNGHGVMNGLDFEVGNASVHSMGTSRIFVNASQTLGVTIDYIGDVFYANNPSLLWVVENHRGRLIQLK
jgi:hypothetical protein